MNESIEQQQQRIGGYMAAVAHLLTGQPGRLEEFIDKAELIVAGRAPNMELLLHWTQRCRLTGMPILCLSPTSRPDVPQLALATHTGGRTHVIENCMLWMGRGERRARLIPDNFAMGAFTFGEDLRLRHAPRIPVRDFDAALPGMARAYQRLFDIEVEQRRTGASFKLPRRLDTALAA